MRQFVDEDDLVGQPPFGDARGEMVADLRARHLAAPSANDDQQRPFVPFGMRDADRRGLGDAGAPDRDVLKLDRTDPFDARFDHVLRALGDLHRAVVMQQGDVAGWDTSFNVTDTAAVVPETPPTHPPPPPDAPP